MQRNSINYSAKNSNTTLVKVKLEAITGIPVYIAEFKYNTC